jgi:hypothetical protein
LYCWVHTLFFLNRHAPLPLGEFSELVWISIHDAGRLRDWRGLFWQERGRQFDAPRILKLNG